MFFEDSEFREQTLASSPENLSGTALEFYQFATGCCQHGFQASDFDLVEDEVQARRAQENVAQRNAQRMAVERRAKELAERKKELAHAARVRHEAEAKARLFATTVQGGSKSESSAGASARGVSQPSSATQSAAQGAPSAGSRQSGRPGPALAVRDSILQTRLCRRLVELRLEEDILEAVLGQLQVMFGQGRAWELANRAGFADVERWEHFVADVQQAKNSWSEGLFIVHVQRHVSELLFALQRAFGVEKEISNEEAKDVLRLAGFEYRIGKIWGENDCLADSLLQLLIFHGLVPEGSDRKRACLDNRVRLESSPDLVPRNIRGRLDFGGFLQHHRHAEATLDFFFERFASCMDLLPAAGVRLLVHTRSDDEEHPVDQLVVCEGRGRGPGPCLDFHLFNVTGDDHCLLYTSPSPRD